MGIPPVDGSADASAVREMIPLADDMPLTKPRQWHWDGITLEYHQQPPGECSLCLPQHVVCLPLLPSATERRIKGQLRPGRVARGSCSIYPSGSTPLVRWLAPMEFLFLVFEPELLTSATESSTSSLELIDHPTELQDELLTQLGIAFYRECASGITTVSQPYIEALTQAFAAHMVRHYTVAQALSLLPRAALTSHQMRLVLDYIHDALQTTLPLAELAAIVGMSPFHFSRAFHATVGQSPHRYILMLRIERAKELLHQTSLSLSDIAAQVGFADQAHFSRTFKRLAGLPPSRYQRQLRIYEQSMRKNMQDR